MQYALLIYERADYRRQVSQEEWDQVLTEHTALWEKYGETTFRAGAGLQGVETATSLRKNGAEYQMTDGPFVEAREVLGGFYIVECSNLDEAAALAKEIPLQEGEGIEIRPVMSGAEQE